MLAQVLNGTLCNEVLLLPSCEDNQIEPALGTARLSLGLFFCSRGCFLLFRSVLNFNVFSFVSWAIWGSVLFVMFYSFACFEFAAFFGGEGGGLFLFLPSFLSF